MPPAGQAILHDVGYYMHAGGHGAIPSDWDVYLKFMELHLRPGRQRGQTAPAADQGPRTSGGAEDT